MRKDAHLDGVLLCRQTEGVKADWMQHVEALVPLQPRHDVCERQAQSLVGRAWLEAWL